MDEILTKPIKKVPATLKSSQSWISTPDACSVASTCFTLSASIKASYSDLSGLVEPDPVMLPTGALEEPWDISPGCDEADDGCRYGKFGSRAQPRQLSFDGINSDGSSTEVSELFMRLLSDADRVTGETGCHVRVQKLTTSKSRPYKTVLRHLRD